MSMDPRRFTFEGSWEVLIMSIDVFFHGHRQSPTFASGRIPENPHRLEAATPRIRVERVCVKGLEPPMTWEMSSDEPNG